MHSIESPFWLGVVQLLLVAAGTYVSYVVLHFVYRLIKGRLLRAPQGESVKTILLGTRLIPRILQVMPLVVAGVLARTLVQEGLLQRILLALTHAYFIFICAHVFSSVMNLSYRLINWRRGVSASPQKGLFQVLTLMGYVFAAVAIVATLSGRDPTYILSGMTALSAVLMLIFKDSILGLTAGVTLSGNGMIRIGDWIEVPGANADGSVIDIALTTVRVQNWDNTITTIPAYDLIAKPFKNWRGMSDSGGRRVKRAIVIDLDTVRFADEAMLERWKEIDLLRDYIATKMREVRTYNAEHPSSKTSVANARKLTNVGTFRAYCLAYLRANPNIHQQMTLLVRQLQPNDRGLPLEIYCFTRDTAWATYENIQSDLFDHFLAIMPEFGLSCFQVTSAASMRAWRSEEA